VTAPAKGPGKGAPQLVPVPDDTDPQQPAPAAPARPRQVTRAKLITTTSLVTAVLAWRFATGHHPGRTPAGHAFWFIVWDVLLTGVLLWLVTGFRHRRYRDRIGRQAAAARTTGRGYAAEWRDMWADWRDRPRGPGPAPDPGSTWGDAKQPAPQAGPGPAPVPVTGRARRRPRPPASAPGGRSTASPAWRAAAAELADVDGESGQEVAARIARAAAGFKLAGEAIGDLHTHVTVDRGYDERAMPSLAEAESGAEEVAATLETALREVTEFYEHLFDAADEGKQAPHDGHEFEED
jgi:hypothetical protein